MEKSMPATLEGTRTPSPEKRRKHNKSKMDGLAVLSVTNSDLQLAYEALQKAMQNGARLQGLLVGGASCIVLPAADGRLSVNQRKLCYGYQLVALDYFGRERLEAVAANKTGTDLTISHLCGTRNCCERTHLILELKRVNDARVHCHTVMQHILQKQGLSKLTEFLQGFQFCPHDPRCGSYPPVLVTQEADAVLSESQSL